MLDGRTVGAYHGCVTNSQTKPTYRIDGRSHDGRVVALDTFHSRDEAEADMQRRVFGAGDRYAHYRIVTVE